MAYTQAPDGLNFKLDVHVIKRQPTASAAERYVQTHTYSQIYPHAMHKHTLIHPQQIDICTHPHTLSRGRAVPPNRHIHPQPRGIHTQSYSPAAETYVYTNTLPCSREMSTHPQIHPQQRRMRTHTHSPATQRYTHAHISTLRREMCSEVYTHTHFHPQQRDVLRGVRTHTYSPAAERCTQRCIHKHIHLKYTHSHTHYQQIVIHPYTYLPTAPAAERYAQTRTFICSRERYIHIHGISLQKGIKK